MAPTMTAPSMNAPSTGAAHARTIRIEEIA
jgi:hypothetical protein